MVGSSHRVQRVVFDLLCRDQTTAFQARRRLTGAFADTLGNVLGEVFDGHSPNGLPYRIGRLEVDLGILELERMDDEQIRDLLLTRLRHRFLDLPAHEVEPVNSPVSSVETLIRFLETGHFPWHAQEGSLSELEKAILELEEDEHRVLGKRLEALFSNRVAMVRFAHQFGREFFLWILDLIHPELPDLIEKLVRSIGGDLSLPVLRIHALEAAISGLSGLEDQLEERIRRRFKAIVNAQDQVGALEEMPAPDAPMKSDEEALYTKVGGLVLLHPFLHRFFDKLDLLTENALFRSHDARTRGVHLLHYLATGEQRPDEHELVLEKILCGMPILTPVDKQLEVLEEEQAESNALLDAVIGHWGKLGSTSPVGLREAFLSREGRLVMVDRYWELVVQQRGVDVLLGALPWSLHRVQLPWMPAEIRVEWA